jgi:hypothetical protein
VMGAFSLKSSMVMLPMDVSSKTCGFCSDMFYLQMIY